MVWQSGHWNNRGQWVTLLRSPRTRLQWLSTYPNEWWNAGQVFVPYPWVQRRHLKPYERAATWGEVVLPNF